MQVGTDISCSVGTVPSTKDEYFIELSNFCNSYQRKASKTDAILSEALVRYVSVNNKNIVELPR